MQVNFTLKLNHMLKKSIISMAMVGAVALALASSGGGDKKKVTVVATGVNTLRTTPGFTLKAGRSYSHSLMLKNSQYNLALGNTVLTYRKGNTIYILPSYGKYNKQQVASRNNLNMLNLKLNLRK
jgi:hypothetical protein